MKDVSDATQEFDFIIGKLAKQQNNDEYCPRLWELLQYMKELEKDRQLLWALQAGGVDNWVGYEDAVEAANDG